MVTADLVATRIVHGAGDALQQLAGQFLASSIRMAGGAWSCTVDATLAQTVSRSGAGQAVLEVAADLYYTRAVLGFGTAVVELELQGHVGVVFIDGQAVIRPMHAELAPTKRVMGQGAAASVMAGLLAPSAIRRISGELMPMKMDGGLEGSHIDAGGVRHIGFSGVAPLGLEAQDAGMLRQAFIGSLDFELNGSGSGSLIKPALAGDAVLGLRLLGGFRVARHVRGEAVLKASVACTGAVVVRGEGEAAQSLRATLTGYKRTYPGLEATIVSVGSSLRAARIVHCSGSAVVGLQLSGQGARHRLGKGAAVIEVLGESDSYLNPNAEDPTEENFSRLAVPRDFARPAEAREWRR
ncbi:Uncharacterised protein [Aquipseudomonas alcaligenes]|nr:Uncharacterised protein [Pseudomonas alcaligenes]